MRSVLRREATPARYLVRATIFLGGILLVGHGYFNDNRAFLFVGVAVIAANVLTSVVDMFAGKGRRG